MYPIHKHTVTSVLCSNTSCATVRAGDISAAVTGVHDWREVSCVFFSLFTIDKAHGLGILQEIHAHLQWSGRTVQLHQQLNIKCERGCWLSFFLFIDGLKQQSTRLSILNSDVCLHAGWAYMSPVVRKNRAGAKSVNEFMRKSQILMKFAPYLTIKWRGMTALELAITYNVHPVIFEKWKYDVIWWCPSKCPKSLAVFHGIVFPSPCHYIYDYCTKP